MKFILISRHPPGTGIPASEQQQNLQAMGEWIALLKPQLAMPTRGGTRISAGATEPCGSDIGGVLVYEADDMDHALALARRSPGLKYGFTHEVYPEITMEQAAG